MSESSTQAQAAQTADGKQQESAKTFTQDEVNSLLAKQKREHFGDYGDLKKKASQYDEITEQAKTEQQRATEALNAARDQATQAEARALRLEIAAEKGLTPAQAKRLVGNGREELESDADELLSTFKPAETEGDQTEAVASALDLGSRGTATATGDPAADFTKFLSKQF